VIADVVVVGGGPAGVAAAITLARAGRDVMLVDKARFPRDKCCGDGLTTGALRRYEALGLRPAVVPSWEVAHGIHVRSPSGVAATFPLPRGRGTFAAVARRVDLDAAFLDVARRTGVRVHDGHAAAGIDVVDDEVVVDVEGLGSVRAHYAIGADGMWSSLRKALLDADADGPGYLGEWHAFRQYFCAVAPAAASELWVWFEPDLVPGYAWSFPLGDRRANVGYGILRRPGTRTKSMKGQWPELLARPHIADVLGPDAAPEGPHKAWPVPARIDATALTAGGGRVLFVGDAARATDPLTGEGIGQALETGMLAAEALLAAGPPRPRIAADRYRAAVGGGLALDHKLAAALSGVLARPGGADAFVRIAGATDWTRRNFSRWLFEDYPRAVLGTPWRWHRGMLTGPGAYRS